MKVVDVDWGRLSESEKVVHLLREVGVSKLANWDGCICSHFSIRNVDVDINCGKGQERGVWVSSTSADYLPIESWGDGQSIQPIADEVHRQVQGADCRGDITLHVDEGRPRGQARVSTLAQEGRTS